MQFKTLLLAGHATQLTAAMNGTNSTIQAQGQGNVSGIATGQMFATLASSYMQYLSQAAAKTNHTKSAIDLTPWANQNLSKIDPNSASWVNGTLHTTTPTKVFRSGVVIEDPYGNKMPLRCRGKSVAEIQEDCTKKAALYMCHGYDKKKLRVRDDDKEHCKNKTAIIIGSVVGVGGAEVLVGGAFWGWKVSASGEVLTSFASNIATASELSIESIVSDALTKVLSTASDSASSSSVIFVETQPELIFAEMADQGVTQIFPDMIEPGLQMAQNTLSQIDISCQAGMPIQQATTQAIEQTISEAPQVLESVEGGSNIAEAFIEAEQPLTELQQLVRDPDYVRYVEELYKLEQLEKANKPHTPPETNEEEPAHDPPKQEGGDQSGKGPENSDGTPPKDPSGENGSGPKEPPRSGDSGNNAGSPGNQGTGNGEGTPPAGPPTGKGDNQNGPPANSGSGTDNVPPPGQGAGNNQGTPPTGPPTTIEPAPQPLSPAMDNLLRNTPHKVRDWDTRWNNKLPRAYTDQMNLFPEDFDWDAATRYWRNLGDTYRRIGSQEATRAGIECSKRVIRLGEWRNFWQTWRAAQQHPAQPPQNRYTIHTTELPTPPVATVVAPPPASGLPPVSVSAPGLSMPHFSATHGPPAPSACPSTLITRTTRSVAVPVTTSKAPPRPPPPPPPPPSEPAPGIPCDPDDQMPTGFTCDRAAGPDRDHPDGHWELSWDPAVIYPGKKCNPKEKLPFTWQCKTERVRGNWRLKRGGWTDMPDKCWDNPRGQGCSLKRMREATRMMALMLAA